MIGACDGWLGVRVLTGFDHSEDSSDGGATMTAYLITFKPQTENPERGWPVEELAALAHRVRKHGSASELWRFNRKKDVKVGERVFLLRQGKQGHAILGYGHVAALPKDKSNMTLVEFEALADPLSRPVYATSNELHRMKGQDKLWRTQSSGIGLPEDVADRLEDLVLRRAAISAKARSDPASPETVTDQEYAADLNAKVANASNDSPAARRKRLETASKKPRRVFVQSTNYMRNPDVIAEVLVRASGRCEGCKAPAPFKRKTDYTPYLEVHHVIHLADDGDDTVENALALCPNCHRKLHFG